MRKLVRYVLLALVVLLVAGQLIPYPPAENSPLGQEVPAPPEVRRILQNSCYDCHSTQTDWPWYSSVVPAKWFVRWHVNEGRAHLNLTAWSDYSPQRASRKLDEVVEMIQDGKMPLRSYLWMHGNAALSQADAERLIAWARDLGGPDEGGGPGDGGES